MKPVVLIILDGFGIAPPGPGNAISLANPPHINSYLYSFPNTVLNASGESVGLPKGEVGNTEVGHINLGAGRIVYQDLPRINMSVADGSFFRTPAFLEGIMHVKKHNSKLHLIGLLGEGAVHSSIEHLYALLSFAKQYNIQETYIHAITDGRDSPPKAALETLQRMEERLKEIGVGTIASVTGRYYAMDRDSRWDRTEKAYLCLTKGIGKSAPSIQEAIKQAYQEQKTDEFIEPTIITKDKPPALISPGDAVIFFNYRIDRPRQLTKAFVLDNFEEANKPASFDPYSVKYYKTHFPHQKPAPPFQREEKIKDLFFITMTEYEHDLPVSVAFPPVQVRMPLARILSEHQAIQLHMGESEKERFVTFYFNGLWEKPFPNEERIIIPSPKVATYDLKPEMSAYELTDILIKKISEKKHQFIIVNFANPDMVGHTGNIQATIQAVKTIDTCLDRIIQIAMNLDYSVFITADHGNVEQKINPHTGDISTEHTDNPVPFIFINKNLQGKNIKLQSGILADVAPTILEIMGIPKPSDMTGRNLLEGIA